MGLEGVQAGGSLTNIVEQESLRWIFVGGKGGVGKTTTACALAAQLARTRGSVLVVSTDPAHNVSDAFRQRFSGSPERVDGFDNLFAMEVDAEGKAGDSLGGAPDGLLADLTSAIPGIDEAMGFAEVLRMVNSLDFDTVVFDTAPTGHTIRLLQLPSALNKSLAKLHSLSSGLGGMLQQAMSMLSGSASGEGSQSIQERLDELKSAVENVSNQFRDHSLTTFVCVCIPEFLSLYETERLVQQLADLEMDCRNIVINQVLFPQEVVASRLLRKRLEMQSKYLEQYDDLYEDFHIVKVPALDEEVKGPDDVKSFSKLLVSPYEPQAVESGSELEQRVLDLEKENAQLRSQLQETSNAAKSS